MTSDILLAIGGLGLFLLGMIIMTEGLKDLAGPSLRRILARFTTNTASSAAAGAVTTAVIQSSSATTVTAIGFVGAGLMTFPQALGVIFGANIGTTMTGWLVALIGFKLDLGVAVLPIVLIGALLKMFGRGRVRPLGWALAGFSLLFIGIDAMQQGMEAFEGRVTPDNFPRDSLIGRLQLVLIGVAITLVTQSSSAGVATAMVALSAGAVSFPQAAAMVIGMDVGTTFTAYLATIGGSTAMRQTGYAHVIYKGTSKNTRHLVPERCRIGVTFFCGREALVVGQMGFFDLANRYGGLDAKNDPLLKIDAVLGWEDFRADLEAVWRKPAAARKSRAGRKPWDAVVMFKAIILCALYNLSDDQVEYQIRDRLSFMRFLGLGLEDRVPDAKTVWLYREQLARAGAIEGLFAAFDGYLKDQGYLAMGGQIIDASIVAAPKQRNSREENARIKAGETPEGWADKPAKRSQKDTDARWTKKRGQSHYGYKNHINVDRRHKLVRHYEVTDASVHDSQVLDDILDGDNTALGVWADSAYRSAEIEAALKAKGLRSRIHRKGRRNKPLSDREKQGNKTRSSVRVRVEHVFGAQSNDMGGTLVRSIGKVRATARIGLKNLAYNMRRLVQLERLGAATA